MALRWLVVFGFVLVLAFGGPLGCSGSEDADASRSGVGSGGEETRGSQVGTSVSSTLPPGECRPGRAECISEGVARVCPPEGDGWLAFACGAGEQCVEGACRGTCEAGASECVADSLARVCAPEGVWIPVSCREGEACSDGACRRTSGVVCEAGEVACATDRAARTCTLEGDGWVVETCGASERCDAGACVLDTEAGRCTPGEGVCVDGRAWRCTDAGIGYEVTDCPENAPCAAGACRGSVCAIGESRCAALDAAAIIIGDRLELGQIYHCEDGERWVAESCPGGTLCSMGVEPEVAERHATDVYLWLEFQSGPFPDSPLPAFARATCEPTSCVSFGGEVIEALGLASFFGDRAETRCVAEDSSLVQRCVGAPPLSPMVRRTETCPPGERCSGGVTGRCESECRAGERICVSGGISTCSADGRWGDPVACPNAADRCLTFASIDRTRFDARCMDAPCYEVLREDGTGTLPELFGVCEGDREIRACDADGRLRAEPVTCPGACVAELSFSGAGRCDLAACEDGTRRCIEGPLYQECVAGRWSSEYLSCGSERTCTAGLGTASCGDCVPGDRRCLDEDTVQVCTNDETWTLAETCSFGACATFSGPAACLADCVPGATICDPVNNIRAARCNERGMWTDFTNCAGDTRCLVDSAGNAMGCVECVGNAQGNHAWGVVDSHCDPGGPGGSVRICGPDNRWQSAEACGAGEGCASNESGFGSDPRYSRIAYCEPI